jgi:hypothetical protein
VSADSNLLNFGQNHLAEPSGGLIQSLKCIHNYTSTSRQASPLAEPPWLGNGSQE